MSPVEGQGQPQKPVSDIDSATFRRVLSEFASGLTVVTGPAAGARKGFTCHSCMAVSLDPSLVVVCPSKRSSSWASMRSGGHKLVVGRAQQVHVGAGAARRLYYQRRHALLQHS